MPSCGIRRSSCQPALTLLDRLAPYVLTVHFKQIERAKDRADVAPMTADEIKHGKSAVVANDRLAVDDDRIGSA